ncbi:MAG: hypothetical protein ACI4RN_01110, partial [Oscillospiraceae bacterium]
DNSKILPLTYGTRWDGGMTSVEIAGVKGELTANTESVAVGKPIYYFSRSQYGSEVKVKKGEKLTSMSMTDFQDYLPIVCVGEDGKWNSFEELAGQIEKIIKTSKNSEDYIVLGLFTVPLTKEQSDKIDPDDDRTLEQLTYKNNIAYDAFMKKKFGTHYVSIREIICSEESVEKLKAIDDGQFELSEDDEKNLHSGIVPNCLKYNKTILNEYGYTLVGDALYERLVDLGYLYH